MNVIDCHVHSELSFDSREPMENYVRQRAQRGDKYFITTEHVDLESWAIGGEDDIAPDFDRQQRLVKELNEKYPVEVLLGVEIGWRKSIHQRNVELALSKPFDMIILSVHEVEYADVSTPQFSYGKTTDQCYDEYLNCIIDAINSFDNFDTFGHVDYVLRYVGHTDLSKHKEKLTQIFKMLIERGKALEINTKVIHNPQAVERMKYIVQLYASVGGEKITLGSDAHTADKYKNGFDLVIETLKANNINSVCGYVGRKEISLPI